MSRTKKLVLLGGVLVTVGLCIVVCYAYEVIDRPWIRQIGADEEGDYACSWVYERWTSGDEGLVLDTWEEDPEEQERADESILYASPTYIGFWSDIPGEPRGYMRIYRSGTGSSNEDHRCEAAMASSANAKVVCTVDGDVVITLGQ